MELGLTVFGRRFELRTKAIPLQPISGRGGWWSVFEPFIGAWQRNVQVDMDSVLTYSAVFACVTLIAADIAKLKLRLVQQDANGIWNEAESPAFSPVLRRPNRYQTTQKFVEQWLVSKLIHGNTYVLKQYDNRGGREQGVVTAMYVLDPSRVTPLVTEGGDVYYELKRDDLSKLPEERLVVPASEIIHDTMVALFHPLMGVTPLFACGLAAQQGLSIQNNSAKVFANGSIPGGILTTPDTITDEQAQRLKEAWDSNYTGDNVGKVAVLTNGLKFEKMAYNAVDLQLIDQLKLTGEFVCSCYHVPAYMIGVGPPPPYANVEPSVKQYYSQCLQTLTTSLENSLDYGLGIATKVNGVQYGTEFDIDDLIWMDTLTRAEAAAKSSGTLSPNEQRKKYFGVGPVKGGETPYLQEQNWPLAMLADRELPTRAPTAPAALPAAPDDVDDVDDDAEEEEAMAASVGPLFRQALIEAGLIHA